MVEERSAALPSLLTLPGMHRQAVWRGDPNASRFLSLIHPPGERRRQYHESRRWHGVLFLPSRRPLLPSRRVRADHGGMPLFLKRQGAHVGRCALHARHSPLRTLCASASILVKLSLSCLLSSTSTSILELAVSLWGRRGSMFSSTTHEPNRPLRSLRPQRAHTRARWLAEGCRRRAG